MTRAGRLSGANPQPNPKLPAKGPELHNCLQQTKPETNLLNEGGTKTTRTTTVRPTRKPRNNCTTNFEEIAKGNYQLPESKRSELKLHNNRWRELADQLLFKFVGAPPCQETIF
jgi:hypothetical protein